MPKLYLKFEQAVLKEITLARDAMTIGRLPDNQIQVDNPAVSGHHARLSWDGGNYILEDTNSLNGTYVNNQRVARAVLKDGDTILVGKHTLSFQGDNPRAVDHTQPPPKPRSQSLEATMVLDTRAARQMLATAGPPPTQGAAVVEAPRERKASLTVLEGKTEEKNYVLAGKMSAIGKSDMASIKLKGWFAPAMAAVINKRENKYFIAASDAKHRVKINSQEISGLRELNDGDIVEVAGVKMTFAYTD